MKMVNRILSWYGKYRKITWIAGITTTTVIPVFSYILGYLLPLVKSNRSIMADDPELSAERTPLNILSFLVDEKVVGYAAMIARIVLLVGCLALVLLMILQIMRFIGSRTKVSGLDEDMRKQEKMDREANDETDLSEAVSDRNPMSRRKRGTAIKTI